MSATPASRGRRGGTGRPRSTFRPALAAAGCVLAAALALGACQHRADFTGTQVDRGTALFAQNCARCHGPGAVGQDPHNPFGSADPARGFVAPALNGGGHCWYHGPQELARLIRKGTGVKGSPMPAWEGKLAPADVVAVIAYLHSLWPPLIRHLYQERFDKEMNALKREQG